MTEWIRAVNELKQNKITYKGKGIREFSIKKYKSNRKKIENNSKIECKISFLLLRENKGLEHNKGLRQYMQQSIEISRVLKINSFRK